MELFFNVCILSLQPVMDEGRRRMLQGADEGWKVHCVGFKTHRCVKTRTSTRRQTVVKYALLLSILWSFGETVWTVEYSQGSRWNEMTRHEIS